MANKVSLAATIAKGLPAMVALMAIACSAEAPPAPSSDVATASQDSHWGHHFCGGSTNHECDDNEVCVSFLSQSCPGPNAVGLCLPRPHQCPAVSDPVCGCDGATYGNLCEAAQNGAALAHRGACSSAPTCNEHVKCPGAGTCVGGDGDDHDGDRRGFGIGQCLHHFFHHDNDATSVCKCSATGSCAAGQRWNDDPSVCACEADANPCASMTCQDTEVCVPGSNGNAECVADACAGIVCKAGNVCVTTADGSASCIADSCSGVVCKNGGVCVVQTDGTSACVPDACSGVVCKNGGTCVVRSDGTAACH